MDKDTYIFMDEPIPPYIFSEEDGICKRGITKEIFDELFGRLGIRYEIRLVPWARALYCAKHGECDGIPLLMKNTERAAFLTYSDPVVENSDLIYYRPDRLGNFRWNTLDDLKDLSIGLVRGYTYSERLLKTIRHHNIPVRYAKDSELNFSMLHAGRVDIIVEDETVAGPLLDRHPRWSKDIRPTQRAVSSYYWHIGLSRKSPLVQHLDDINRALEAMRTDGSLETILNKQ
ncbi:substrate-binding periplasmic protein [Pseudodesulfovibrio sediminis]|nr:transporter substrate-binding domain-containing protein [Pseudodesulfovibrio sediminis]